MKRLASPRKRKREKKKWGWEDFRAIPFNGLPFEPPITPTPRVYHTKLDHNPI